VEEGGELPSTIAFASGCDARELLAHVLGGDQSTTPSSASNRRFTSSPAEP
jgi:hypothetical protein